MTGLTRTTSQNSNRKFEYQCIQETLFRDATFATVVTLRSRVTGTELY